MGRGFSDFDGARRATCDRCQKCYRALDRPRLLRRVHSTLEALTGIGHETEATRAPEERCRRKVSRLEKDIAGPRCDSRALTPHDAREPDWTLAIGDEEDICFGRHELAVEQRQR